MSTVPETAQRVAGEFAWRLGQVSTAVLGIVLVAWALTVDLPKSTSGFFGDASTYYSLGHSLAEDFDFAFRREDLVRVWREFPSGPEGIFLKRGRDVHGLQRSSAPPFFEISSSPDPDPERLYYAKGFIYPLFAAPLVWLFGTNGFLVLHALLMTLCFACAYGFLVARSSPIASLVFAAAFLLMSVAPVEENRVVAGQRSEDLGPFLPVERLCDGLGAARERLDHEQVPRPFGPDEESGQQPLEGGRAVPAFRRRRVMMAAFGVGDLDETKLSDVAGERGLRHVESLAGEEFAQVLLTGDPMGMDQLADGVVPGRLAHAKAPGTAYRKPRTVPNMIRLMRRRARNQASTGMGVAVRSLSAREAESKATPPARTPCVAPRMAPKPASAR
jgi:hypothetical protein